MKTVNMINPLTRNMPEQVKSTRSPAKKFSSVNMNHGLAAYKCPDCHGVFGLQVTLIEIMESTNFHCICPYCGKDGGIES